MGTVEQLFKKGAEIIQHRGDSWINVALGFGTSRDKTQGGYYQPGMYLQDQELVALYQDSDLAAKIVNVYPREAMRGGFCLTGLDADVLKKCEQFLKAWRLETRITEVWIWSRLFGGGAHWPVTDEGGDPALPLSDGEKTVVTLRFFDRRFLQPVTYYKTGPKVGLPETYVLTDINSFGGGRPVGRIHETRLVFYPGARTEAQTRKLLGDWDLSVLQVVYQALRSDGNIWKAIELLVSDANKGVYKLKNLWAMISGKQKNLMQERVKIMDLTRSVSRAILLDKDDEDFERKPTNFSGLHELSDKSLQRVSSAAEIPVTILLGEAPAGLNATGASDLVWFFGRVDSERTQTLEPIILDIVNRLLSSKGSPVAGKDLSGLGIKWKPLWQPTAKEKAEIEKLEADADSIRIKDEVVTPEEVAMTRFGGDEPGPIVINVEARQRILDLDEATSKAAATAAGEGESKDQTQALNGAQIANMLAIVQSVATKEIPVESGKAMLLASFPLTEEQVNDIIDKAGTSFEPPKPEPKALPFGGPPAGPGQIPPKPPGQVTPPAEKPPSNGSE